MVADGIHSLSDMLTDIVVVVFTHISAKGKDRRHSFGHGKFETLATLIVGVVLVAVGVEMMIKGGFVEVESNVISVCIER